MSLLCYRISDGPCTTWDRKFKFCSTGTGDIRGVPWDTGNARATHRARGRARALDMDTVATELTGYAD